MFNFFVMSTQSNWYCSNSVAHCVVDTMFDLHMGSKYLSFTNFHFECTQHWCVFPDRQTTFWNHMHTPGKKIINTSSKLHICALAKPIWNPESTNWGINFLFIQQCAHKHTLCFESQWRSLKWQTQHCFGRDNRSINIWYVRLYLGLNHSGIVYCDIDHWAEFFVDNDVLVHRTLMTLI